MAHFSLAAKQNSLWLVYFLIIATFPSSSSAFTLGRSMIRKSIATSSKAFSKFLAGRERVGARMISLLPYPGATQSRHGRTIQKNWISTASTLKSTLVEPDTNVTYLDSEVVAKNELEKETEPTVNGDVFQGLKSRPVEGGNWNPNDPLAWAQDFGGRSPECDERLQSLIRLKPGDEGYFDVSDLKIPMVTMVRTKEEAKIVMEKLMNADPAIIHACDTEVMDINLKEVGPVGNGYVTCASIYSGPDFDYGLGDGPGSTLWIDNLDDACGILQEFKDWFEDPTKLKVWHNYGFDRHVMWNEGIDCQGFGGDTMHMARLQDTSRLKSGGSYSLEALTAELLSMRKRPMKEIFGVPRLRKDGTPGSIIDVPAIEILQRDPKFRSNFILYSCYDAEGTWRLHEKLVVMLQKMNWLTNGKNLYDYYWDNMREFGKVLTDMERRGIRVDAKEYLYSVEKQARRDREEHSKKFREWAATKIGPDGLAMNPASSTQLGTFLFGGAQNLKTKQPTETRRVFKVGREEIPDDAWEAYKRRDEEERESKKSKHHFLFSLSRMSNISALTSFSFSAEETETDHLDQMTAVQLKELCKEQGLKRSGKKADLKDRLREHFLSSAHPEAEENEFESMSDEELRSSLTGRNLDTSGTRKELLERLKGDIEYMRDLETALPHDKVNGYRTITEALEAVARNGGTTGEILADIKAKSMEEPKWVELTITSLGMKPGKRTAGGAPSVTADVLRKLAGDPYEDPPNYGSVRTILFGEVVSQFTNSLSLFLSSFLQAYDFFGGGDAGHEACVALFSLCAIGSIDTMIANFLTSLQSLADHQSRVHCSLNLNTETGRLSSRRPNLQNQPALEKDKYKIRKAFQSSPGNSLIVADYGQLELRLLASMTNCKSMIDAFESGGDFHSRTAMDMFDHVKKMIDDGDLLLEWDYENGDPPKPLLKDEFGSERRKAKTLNFSIAYGKTAHGLSKDWGVSQSEAQAMLDKWYDARPEVRDWQKNTKAYARKFGITRTLMGRYRQLPEAKSGNRGLIGHAERASINTPIQGGAADVAMMAMNKINNNKKLQRLGWILLMQIHDEVILEGPEETAAEAYIEVTKCMEAPWVPGLEKTSVPLLVDGSYVHKTWYDAK